MHNWQRFLWGGEWSQNVPGHPRVKTVPGGLDHLRSDAVSMTANVRFLNDGTAEPDMGWKTGDHHREFTVMGQHELAQRRDVAVS